jgi:hypothetical protein
MSDTKEVSVSLSEADVKAFSRGGTRRGRKPRGGGAAVAETEPTIGGGADVAVVKNVADTAAPVGSSGTLTPAAAPALPSVPAAQLLTVVPAAASVAAPAPAPVVSSTAVVGGGVKLQAKKVVGGAKAPSTAYTANTLPANTVGTAKIIPTKKHISTAPAARTLKKPRLVVGGANTAPVVTTNAPQNETNAQKGGVQPPQPQKRRRRFTERRISIEVKSAKTTRRHRRKVKANVAVMPIANVRDTLIAKGVLKPKADGKLPPDDMMRSMLKDYMLLHAAE